MVEMNKRSKISYTQRPERDMYGMRSRMRSIWGVSSANRTIMCVASATQNGNINFGVWRHPSNSQNVYAVVAVV